jgi:hypothetical protein
MSFRVEPELKAALDECAEKSGRSLMSEIATRLQNSRAYDNALTLALRLALRGPPNNGLALFFGEILSQVTRWSETLGDANWYEDADAFKAVEDVLLEILERARPQRQGPPDEARIADYRRHARLPLLLLELEMIGKRRPGQRCPEWLSTLIGELGPLAQCFAPPAEPPPSIETAEAPKRRRRAA